MSDADQPVSLAPLLVTVVVIAACTSVLWFYFWQEHDRSHERELEFLGAQLEQRVATETGLLQQYAAAEDARRRSEQALVETRTRLDAAEQALARLESDDWEGRYRAAVAENYELSERITELELRHVIARDRLEAEHVRLLETHAELQQSLATLENEHAELTASHHRLESDYHDLKESHAELEAFDGESLSALNERLSNDLAMLEHEHDAALDELNALRERQQTLEAALAESRDELQQARRDIEQQGQAGQSPQVAVATPPAAAPSDHAGPGYRIARLQSLGQAMQGRDSSDRRSILTTVIPTIPDGVTGNELNELIAGMNSADIAQLIRATRRYINTPLDGSSFDQIMAKLAEADARDVLDLLRQ